MILFLPKNKGYLFAGTAGTQCLAISAPLPFRISTDLQNEKPNTLEARYKIEISKYPTTKFLSQFPFQKFGTSSMMNSFAQHISQNPASTFYYLAL